MEKVKRKVVTTKQKLFRLIQKNSLPQNIMLILYTIVGIITAFVLSTFALKALLLGVAVLVWALPYITIGSIAVVLVCFTTTIFC